MDIEKKFESIDPIKKLGLIGGGVVILLILMIIFYTLITEMINASDTIVNILGFLFLGILFTVGFLVMYKFTKEIKKTINQLKEN